MSTFFVVGGAGYIGSHVVKELTDRNQDVVVLDDLSTGHIKAVNPKAQLIIGNLSDQSLIESVFDELDIDCVMHLGGSIVVPESVTSPIEYYQNNVSNTLCLLKAMVRHRVHRIIFSSSAAVYGTPLAVPIVETHPLSPTSPYGRTKLMVEDILADAQTAYAINSVSLRYFNAAGADDSGLIGEAHRPETHLIPLAIMAAMQDNGALGVFGTDWDTPDGTCIRDYIHVTDLAMAHILAAQYLMDVSESRVLNLGCAQGYSVLDVIKTVERVSNLSVPTVKRPRRPGGDPSTLIASADKAYDILGWKPKNDDIERIIYSAWKWHTNPAF